MGILEQEGTSKMTAFSESLAIAAPADYAASREVMHRASKNYSFAARYLPPDKRHHVQALYALLRVGDDRVDVSHKGFSSPLAAIDDWERTYWLAFDHGDSPDPVMRAYLNTALECGIPSETMRPYFRAMREDISIHRFPTFDHLLHYMEGSAMPVGRAMTYILGVESPGRIADALPGADALSIAMQLSNFWRDVGEDWERGRVYIPQEDLDFFNYRHADLAAGRINRSFTDLMEYQFGRTERYYQQAEGSVSQLASGRWAVMSGLEIYRGIMSAIRWNNYDVFTRRSGLSKVQKLSVAMKAYWKVARSR
jgi:phytoene synthase